MKYAAIAIGVGAWLGLTGFISAQPTPPTPAIPKKAEPVRPMDAKPAPAPVRPIKILPVVEERGNGPVPMVLIPSVLHDWTVWEKFMERNKDRYTMYAVTLPGMCGTEPPEKDRADTWEQDLLLSNAVRAIEDLVDFGKLDRPVIVGHGLGGHLAMRFALDHPDKTRAVVAIEAMPYIPLADPSQKAGIEERKDIIRKTTARDLMKLTDEEWRSKAFANTLTMVQDEFRARELAIMMNKTDRAVGIFYFLEMMLSDVSARMQDLKAPMLVIAAISPDPVPPPSFTRELWTRALGAPPNTTLTYYPNCRHMVMDDDPAQLDHDVALFIAGEPIPGAKTTTGAPPAGAPPAPAPRDTPRKPVAPPN